jgi:hypothetical protein
MTPPALRFDQHDPGRLHEQSQAAKSRPLANASPLPIAATMALEMIGPMPGTLTSRSQPASQSRHMPTGVDFVWIIRPKS